MTTKTENNRHFFQLKNEVKRIRVYKDEILLADTVNAILLKEVGNQVMDGVYYIPLEDLKMEYFKATDLHTVCPIKGKASYYSLEKDADKVENIAWTYLNPLPRARKIKEKIAFYADKVSFRIDPK